jgi:hypothetical protein
VKFAEIKDQIIQIAKDKWNNQCFPVRSNHPSSVRAFRVPDNGEPLGFDFHGTSIEVHRTHLRNVRIQGTARFRNVPVLLILGLNGNKLKVIAKDVQAHE